MLIWWPRDSKFSFGATMCIALPAEITGDYILPLGGRDVQHQYGNRILPEKKKVSHLKKISPSFH